MGGSYIVVPIKYNASNVIFIVFVWPAVSVSVSGWTLVAISVERFYAIRHPLVRPPDNKRESIFCFRLPIILVVVSPFSSLGTMNHAFIFFLFVPFPLLFDRHRASGKRGVMPGTLSWPFGSSLSPSCHPWLSSPSLNHWKTVCYKLWGEANFLHSLLSARTRTVCELRNISKRGCPCFS